MPKTEKFINISNSVMITMKTKILGLITLSMFTLVAMTSLAAAENFCNNGEYNTTHLEIRNVDIENGNGDDNEWYLLDVVEIEVEFRNNRDVDLEEVVFELGLFKEGSDSNVIDDLDWKSSDEEEVEIGDVDDGETESHVFRFVVDTEIDPGDYELKVKAYSDESGSEFCLASSGDLAHRDFGSGSDEMADVEIKAEDDPEKSVIVDFENIEDPINAFCGQGVTLGATVYNIGEDDYDDRIKVTLSSAELGIEEEDVIDGDLESGEKVDTGFSFRVPPNADEKTYVLSMRTYYDYDEDDGRYKEVSDRNFDLNLKVDGNCQYATEDTTTITGNLESGGEAGEKLVVSAIVTNTGTRTVEYSVSLSGYSGWASSGSLSPLVFTAGPGRQREVTAEFDVKENAEGKKSFRINVMESGRKVKDRTFQVEIPEKPSWLEDLATSLGLPGAGHVIGLAVGINLFLLFTIFVVALARRR